VDEDLEAPALLNVYKQSGRLFIILNEETTCEAKNEEFTFGEGLEMTEPGSTVHSIEIDSPIYKIECVDAFENPLSPIEVVP